MGGEATGRQRALIFPRLEGRCGMQVLIAFLQPEGLIMGP